MSLIAEMRELLGEAIERATVVAPHKPTEKLTKLDEPVAVRAWWNGYKKRWEALEGSHRLAIANRYHVPVKIIPVRLTDVFPNENEDGSAIYGQDPGVQAISVYDALEKFRAFGKQVTYELDVIV